MRAPIAPALCAGGPADAERAIVYAIARATHIDADVALEHIATRAPDATNAQRLTVVIDDADALCRARAAGARTTLGTALEHALATEPRLTVIACTGRPLGSPHAAPGWPHTGAATTVHLPTPAPTAATPPGRWPFGDEQAPAQAPAVVPEDFAHTPIAIVLVSDGPATTRATQGLRIESEGTAEDQVQVLWITDDNGHECTWRETRSLARTLGLEAAPTLWTSSGSSVRAIDRALLANARIHHVGTGTTPTLLLRAEAANARANHAAALYRPAPHALIG